ncbi:MAG: hypothetical protein Kow0022_09030 [Phycisphaerales bacterium]
MNKTPMGRIWIRHRTLRVVLTTLAAVLIGAPALVLGGWAPEPDPIPTHWELNFEPGPLRIVHLETSAGPRDYFYLTYRVENHTGKDQVFAPSFDLVTKEGAIRRSGRDVPAEVTEKILAMLRNPLLEDQISILGNILQGVENARDGLVIWPVDDLETDSISIFVAGLSGENKPYMAVDAATGRNKRVMLRKTLMLNYDTPGSLAGRGAEPLELVEQKWVMR